MKKKSIFLLTAFVVFLCSRMNARVIRIFQPKGIPEKQLVQFHEPTCESSPSKRPFLSQINLPDNEGLVAKINTFGLDRYYRFENDADIDHLIQSMVDGATDRIFWYLLEKESLGEKPSKID